ncbi:MAG TPA: regulatory protein GemA [Bacteroidota bacterium]|nr:regulatory protein GemA [Bacteroidota bacterium]
MEITKKQIQLIHIAKSQLKLDDETYRAMLAGFGVESSKDLDYSDAEKLLDQLRSAGFKISPKKNDRIERYGWGRNTYENLKQKTAIKVDGRKVEIESRKANYASPAKLRKIEILWRIHSRNKTDKGLQSFCKRITGLDDITFLSNELANKLINAIEHL